MKIRVMGTKAECEQAQRFYEAFGRGENVNYCSVSDLYPNRGSNNQYRVYVEITCKDETNIFGDLFPSVVNLGGKCEKNENMCGLCKTCGDCACYVNGKCYFYHHRGKVTDVEEKAEACKYFMQRSQRKSIFNPDFSGVAEIMEKLKEQYGHDVRCGECSWFNPYENNSGMGICEATRFDLEMPCDGYACHRFELLDNRE